jgi:FKBP-type peptidyl-prolyl cis-trans isomerase
MNKILYILSLVILTVSCELAGVNEPTVVAPDTTTTLSATDSAFINLKKEIKPIKSDTATDEKGLPMVWNGNDGLRIEWETRTSKDPIRKNDLLLANYEARVARGEVYDSNREAGKPLPLKLGIGQLLQGWEDGLLQMSIGDKGRIMIPSKLAYGENGYLGKIPRNADIIVEIEIVKKVKPLTLEEGVKVYQYTMGNPTNPLPIKDQAITFDYFTYKTGKNAGMYDNSYAKGQPFTVKFENDNVVDGLHQGLAVLRAGDHAFIEIPSKLAYGKSGLADLVPPNTDIVFDIRIESIK